MRFLIGFLYGIVMGGPSLATEEMVTAEPAPKYEDQPRPENIVFYQMLRWHDCEARTVCYVINGGPPTCMKDIDTPWLYGECDEQE